MMPLITIAEADAHLRLDLENAGGSPLIYTDDRLANVEMKIAQAEAIILNYLKRTAFPDPDDSPQVWTESDVLVVKASIFLLLSALFDDANGRTVEDYMRAGGTIPLLLVRLRDPAIA
jgi:hypothetical protein